MLFFHESVVYGPPGRALLYNLLLKVSYHKVPEKASLFCIFFTDMAQKRTPPQKNTAALGRSTAKKQKHEPKDQIVILPVSGEQQDQSYDQELIKANPVG